MKHTIHTPTEQYGFVETEYDENDLAQEPILAHKSVVNEVKGEAGEGLPQTEWHELLHSLMTKAPRTEPVPMERMSKEQRYCAREVRNYLVRTNK